ncbi:MAG: hypothetical protein Q4G02_04115 [bacterium]|nr:hypothetical protein [bacterium]
MTWVYSALGIAIFLFAFLLYLISDFSPLARQDTGEMIDLSNLTLDGSQEASSEIQLNLDTLDLQ